MKLEQLLLELREGILNDRTDRVSGTSDYLWPDARLVMYINEAQVRFASHAFVIRDGTTDEVTAITINEGQDVYPLHDSVLAVVSAKIEGQRRDLARVGHAVLAGYQLPTERIPFSAETLMANPGHPLAFSTDEAVAPGDTDSFGNVSLRLHPVPSADAAGGTLRLRVVRKPIEELSLSNPGCEPEIPQQHHIEMLDWAAYLALRIVDDDAGAPKRALEFRASFEEHVKKARAIAMRKLFAPIAWGPGRNGWVWER